MLRQLLVPALVFHLLSPAITQEESSGGSDVPALKTPILQIGDKAPALAIEKWLKGEPVKAFEKGKVYVVEFWATWCPPCIASMPHLTELQKKHKDKGLRIISVTSEDPRNSLDAVEAMVKKQGDEKMGYTVAWDKGSSTNDAFMVAARRNGIPCAFIVNGDGVVAYIGHPMGMDKPIETIIAGKYDIQKARELTKLKEKLQATFQKQDWRAAVDGIDAIVKVDPEGELELHAQKFLILLLPLQDYDKAYALGKELLDKQFKDEFTPLNQMAWTILDNKDVEKRDLDLALAMAERASELTKAKDPSILDTLALAQFKKGDAKKALATQELALGLAGTNEELKDELKVRLQMYKDAVTGKKDDGAEKKDDVKIEK